MGSSLIPSLSALLSTTEAGTSLSSFLIGLVIGESTNISKDGCFPFLISFSTLISFTFPAVVAWLSLHSFSILEAMGKDGVSCFITETTFSSLMELRATSFSFFLSCNRLVSFEDETEEPEVFCELLDDDPSSFRLSLELDLDLCLLLSFDRSLTLSLAAGGDCCGRVRSFLLSLDLDLDRDFDCDFEQDRPRLRSFDLALDRDPDLDLERDFD